MIPIMSLAVNMPANVDPTHIAARLASAPRPPNPRKCVKHLLFDVLREHRIIVL